MPWGPLLVLGKIMSKANNCLKILCYPWASCLRLTHELQTFYSFLDINQKSHEQVFFAQESCSNNLSASDEGRKNIVQH